MPTAEQPGIVVARFNKYLTIEDQNGTLIAAVARRKLPPLVCGDRVHWHMADGEKAVIVGVEERTTLLARPDPRGRTRPMAANIDQMIIVCAIDEKQPLLFNERLIDRYLVTAEVVGINPLILINKIDLVDAPMLERIQEHFRLYQSVGYAVIFTSCHNRQGYADLTQQLPHHTSIFVGESGVGKSSLINDLLPDHDLRIGQLSALGGKGMHTTTATTLYHLPHGGDLIDSPGVREFGLSLQDSHVLANGFREFRPYIGQCKFRNCRHLGEQGCALTSACEHGDIDRRRLDSYQALAREME